MMFVVQFVLFSQSALPNPMPSNDAERVFPASSFLSQRETWAAFAVLVFGLILSLIATYLVKSNLLSGDDTIRLTALILIVTGTLFLVTAGYNAQQIAPALGLLGTVAGYMLGRSDGHRRHTSPEREEDSNESK
jgi:hypothetical protein